MCPTDPIFAVSSSTNEFCGSPSSTTTPLELGVNWPIWDDLGKVMDEKFHVCSTNCCCFSVVRVLFVLQMPMICRTPAATVVVKNSAYHLIETRFVKLTCKASFSHQFCWLSPHECLGFAWETSNDIFTTKSLATANALPWSIACSADAQCFLLGISSWGWFMIYSA